MTVQMLVAVGGAAEWIRRREEWSWGGNYRLQRFVGRDANMFSAALVRKHAHNVALPCCSVNAFALLMNVVS